MRMANRYRQILLQSDKENKTDKEESRRFSEFVQETGEIFGAGFYRCKRMKRPAH